MRDSETLFEDLYETAPAAYASLRTADGSVTRHNAAFAELFGYRREALDGLPVFALHPDTPDGLPKAKQIFEDFMSAAIKGGQTHTREAQAVRKDGTILWVSINIRGHFDDDGTLTETRSMVLDITARKNAEAELRKSQEQFEDLYENAPIAYSTRRAEDGKLIRHNAAFAKLLGYERVEIQQMEGFAFYPDTPDGLPKIQRWFEDFRADPKPAVSEVQVRRKDGQLRWVTASSEPRFDENGKLIESRSAVTDITERRRDEERLRAARAEAEGANRAKSEFLSSMSHELRTPMNTVLGFAQILKSDPESPLNPDQTESIDQIIHGGTHLLELINEVLDLSRIESGGADLSPEWVDLGELAAESLDLMAPLAAHRRITLVNDVGDRGGRAWADYTRLKQVLLNLVSNAVKYNVDGGTVTISALPTAAGRARVAITDTGPGIAEDRLDELFAPFVRLGAEWSEVEGTGIGRPSPNAWWS